MQHKNLFRRAAVVGGIPLAVAVACAGVGTAAPDDQAPTAAQGVVLPVSDIANPLAPFTPGYVASPEQRIRDYEEAGMWIGGTTGLYGGMVAGVVVGGIIGGVAGVPIGLSTPVIGQTGAIGIAIGGITIGSVVGLVGGLVGGAALGRQIGGDIARSQVGQPAQ